MWRLNYLLLIITSWAGLVICTGGQHATQPGTDWYLRLHSEGEEKATSLGQVLLGMGIAVNTPQQLYAVDEKQAAVNYRQAAVDAKLSSAVGDRPPLPEDVGEAGWGVSPAATVTPLPPPGDASGAATTQSINHKQDSHPWDSNLRFHAGARGNRMERLEREEEELITKSYVVESVVRQKYAKTKFTRVVYNPSVVEQALDLTVVYPATALISKVDIDGRTSLESEEDPRIKWSKRSINNNYDRKRVNGAGTDCQYTENFLQLDLRVRLDAGEQISLVVEYQQLLTRRLGDYTLNLFLSPGEVITNLTAAVRITDTARIHQLAVRAPRMGDITSQTLKDDRDDEKVIKFNMTTREQAQWFGTRSLYGVLAITYQLEQEAVSLTTSNGYFLLSYSPSLHLPVFNRHLVLILNYGKTTPAVKSLMHKIGVDILRKLSPGDRLTLLAGSVGRNITIRTDHQGGQSCDNLTVAIQDNATATQLGQLLSSRTSENSLKACLGFLNNQSDVTATVLLSNTNTGSSVNNITEVKMQLWKTMKYLNKLSLMSTVTFVNKPDIGASPHVEQDAQEELISAAVGAALQPLEPALAVKNVAITFDSHMVDPNYLSKTNFDQLAWGSEILVAGVLRNSPRGPFRSNSPRDSPSALLGVRVKLNTIHSGATQDYQIPVIEESAESCHQEECNTDLKRVLSLLLVQEAMSAGNSWAGHKAGDNSLAGQQQQLDRQQLGIMLAKHQKYLTPFTQLAAINRDLTKSIFQYHEVIHTFEEDTEVTAEVTDHRGRRCSNFEY